MKIKSKNRKKYYLKIHLVFVTKYRRSTLAIEEINNKIKIIFKEIMNKYEFHIEDMEMDNNHIHFLIEYPPNVSISNIVRVLKQQSCFKLWKEYENILSRYYYKEKTFWGDGYFVSSVGEVNEEIIKNYIINQGK